MTPETLALSAHEYGYRMPSSVAAGLVRVVLTNQGGDVHEGLIVRFSGDSGNAVRYVDSVRAGVDYPAFASDIGGPGLTLPGDSSVVWLALTPGRYAVFCWKAGHLKLGMAHDLEVTAAKGPAATAPVATAELILRDYAFDLASPLQAGPQVLHVRNEGTEPHEADIFRLTDSTTIQDYIAWLEQGDEVGIPPVDPVGGLGDIVPGREIWMAINLEPGRYFILCGIPASGDGKPHYKHGMVLEFTVS